MTSLTAGSDNIPNTKTITRACPRCGAPIPVDPNYVDWCDHCGWNVQPLPPLKPKNRFDKLYLSLGDRMGKSLLDQFIHAESLQPRLTFAKVIAYLIALLAHGFTVALIVMGIWLIVAKWPYLVFILFGLLALLIAYMVRPYLPKMPQGMLTRDQAPHLYRLVDRVQEALHAPKVHGIVIDGVHNASYGLYGVRGKRILTLGMPLVAAMDGQQLVALIGHEMAHSVNGDVMHSYVVGSAVHSLFEMYSIIGGYSLELAPRYLILTFLIFPFQLIKIGIAYIPYTLAYLLMHLLWQDCQRAEYWADYLAARVSGTQSTITMLKKFPLYGVFSVMLQHIALNKRQDLHLFDEYKSSLAAVPAREYERISRAMKMDQSRLDMTHPPTAYRLAFLEAHPCLTAEVTCSQAEYEAIYRELEPQQKEIQSELVDLYLSHLYAG